MINCELKVLYCLFMNLITSVKSTVSVYSRYKYIVDLTKHIYIAQIARQGDRFFSMTSPLNPVHLFTVTIKSFKMPLTRNAFRTEFLHLNSFCTKYACVSLLCYSLKQNVCHFSLYTSQVYNYQNSVV